MKLLAALIAVYLSTAPACAHDHNHPELKGWFEGLQSGRGICCDGEEVLHLSDVDWSGSIRKAATSASACLRTKNPSRGRLRATRTSRPCGSTSTTTPLSTTSPTKPACRSSGRPIIATSTSSGYAASCRGPAHEPDPSVCGSLSGGQKSTRHAGWMAGEYAIHHSLGRLLRAWAIAYDQ